MDIGTLFQSRNFLNARTVPSTPMKDVNACKDLLLKYTDALLILAFRHYCSKENISLDERRSDEANKLHLESILSDSVEDYVIPEVKFFYSLLRALLLKEVLF